ncbi:uncharacterized protein LOC144880237 [Branchiostoma floridae x Branchiostoma japonicum]
MHEEMNFWLMKFIFEVRRIDGKPYPPKTLYCLVSGLMRHFREDLNRHDRRTLLWDMNFLDRSDIRFAEFRKALDAKMKELTAAGVGVTKRQADPLTTDDEDRLWESNTISLSTSEGMSYGVYFYNCKVFGFRAMDEHLNLLIEQYRFGTDTNGHYMYFTGMVSKNVQGGYSKGRWTVPCAGNGILVAKEYNFVKHLLLTFLIRVNEAGDLTPLALPANHRRQVTGFLTDVDQFFSRVAEKLRKRDATTVEELVDVMEKSFPNVEGEELDAWGMCTTGDFHFVSEALKTATLCCWGLSTEAGSLSQIRVAINRTRADKGSVEAFESDFGPEKDALTIL